MWRRREGAVASESPDPATTVDASPSVRPRTEEAVIALYVVDEALGAPLEVGSEIRRAGDWKSFLKQAGRAECAVIACRGRQGDTCVAHLREFRSAHPFAPLVLYTDEDSRLLREVADLVVEEVVFAEEGLSALARSIRCASRGWFQGFASMVHAMDGMNHRLRRLLRTLLAAPRPYVVVTDLAEAVGVAPATVQRHWREHWPGPPPLRLEDLLAWIVILWAYMAKHPGNRWKGIATRLGVTPRHLRDLSRRLGLGTLRDLEAMAAEAFLDRFDRHVCRPLTGESLLERLNRPA